MRSALSETRIGFVSIKPSPSRRELLGVHYLDVFTPMLNATGEPRAELFIGDQLHLNRSGHVL